MHLNTHSGAADLPLAEKPAFGELLRTAFRIGCLSFGGAAGQIAMLHKMLVEEKRWIGERDFLNGLNFCTLLPGPEAQQLATYIGWRLHGVAGGLAAGGLFVLPGALLILLLAQAYVLGAKIPLVAGLLMGIKAAVVAIILDALIRLSRRALGTGTLKLVGLAAFLAMGFTSLPFPLVIAGAALVGAALSHSAGAVLVSGAPTIPSVPFVTTAVCLVAWWAPVAVAALWLGGDHLLVEIGVFFSKLAVVTFGGAYALLAWLSEAAVARGWVDPVQMLDALGLAETTPGPTILVNPFIAFIAGAKAGGVLLAWMAGLMAIWTTFAPSFLWIFVGGPFIDRITGNARLAGALKGISAAVVGIIGSVGFKFAVLFLFARTERIEAGFLSFLAPAGAPIPLATGLGALAFGLLFLAKWPMLRMLGLLALAGLAVGFAT